MSDDRERALRLSCMNSKQQVAGHGAVGWRKRVEPVGSVGGVVERMAAQMRWQPL